VSESWCTPICKICFEGGHETEACTEDKKDFELVSPLAAFIGARLNYVLPPCNSGPRGGKLVSTIKVDQHKEKFWYARVYCTLADESMIVTKWVACRTPGAENEDPTPEFVARCLRFDALHYRKCYMDAVKIIPRMRKRLVNQADYRELLFEDANALTAYIDELMRAESDGQNVRYLEHYLRRWHVKDGVELKNILLSFYERPSLKEMSDA
jgi:hypothetical protein